MDIDLAPLLVIRELDDLAAAACAAVPRDRGKLAFCVLLTVGIPALVVEVADIHSLGTVFTCGKENTCRVVGNVRLEVVDALVHAVVADVFHLDARPVGERCVACPCVNIDFAPLLVIRELDNLVAACAAVPRERNKLAFCVLLTVGIPALVIEVVDIHGLRAFVACGKENACRFIGNVRLEVVDALVHAVVADVFHLDARPVGERCLACPCVDIDFSPLLVIRELDDLVAAADFKAPVQSGIDQLVVGVFLCVSAVYEPALAGEIGDVGGLGIGIRRACRKEVTLDVSGDRRREVVDAGIEAVFAVVIHQHTRPLHGAVAAPSVNINAGPVQVVGEPYRHIRGRRIGGRIGGSLGSGSDRSRSHGGGRYGSRRDCGRRLSGLSGRRSNCGRRLGRFSCRRLNIGRLLNTVVKHTLINRGRGVGGQDIDVRIDNLGMVDDKVVVVGVSVAELQDLNIEIDDCGSLGARLGLEGNGNKRLSVAVIGRLDTVGAGSVASDAAALDVGGIGVDNGVPAVCQTKDKIF